jgi:tight adherence protein B
VTVSITGGLLAAGAAVAAVAGTRSAVAARTPRARAASGASSPSDRLPGGRALRARLRAAGLEVSPVAFAGAAAATGIVAAIAMLLVFRQQILGLVALPVGVAAGRVAIGVADRRHARRVGEAMPAVAQMLASAVAAGLSLRQAIIRSARDTPDPLGAELRRASAEMELGARVDDALTGLSARLPDPDLGLLVTAILVQRRTGGDLARALRDMSARLEERGRLAREIRGATAQARATAWMVAALPLLAAGLAESAAPGLISRTASTPVGVGVLVASVVLQVAGILMIRRIAAVQA